MNHSEARSSIMNLILSTQSKFSHVFLIKWAKISPSTFPHPQQDFSFTHLFIDSFNSYFVLLLKHCPASAEDRKVDEYSLV